VTVWDDYQTLLANGFQPPRGPGRCERCAFHTLTQGHRAGCPNSGKRRQDAAPRKPNLGRGRKVREHPPATDPQTLRTARRG
jgi:hypothetical protein